MQTTVVSRGGEDSTDGDLDARWAGIVNVESLAFDFDSSDPVPFDIAPDWRWLASPRVRRGAIAARVLSVPGGKVSRGSGSSPVANMAANGH